MIWPFKKKKPANDFNYARMCSELPLTDLEEYGVWRAEDERLQPLLNRIVLELIDLRRQTNSKDLGGR